MSKDTIYREDAIDEMERIMADHPLQGYEDELLLIDAIKSLPSADRPQEWIPCSERLPRPYTEVLVCDECGWVSLGSYRPCDVTEKDSGWSTLTSIKLPTDEVLAWMPLPKPWKGADNETD